MHEISSSTYSTSVLFNTSCGESIWVPVDSYATATPSLGTKQIVQVTVKGGIEKFLCAIYRTAGIKTMNDVRYISFQEHYVPMNSDNLLGRMKGINPSSIPPCQSVLHNKITCSNCMTYAWLTAHQSNHEIDPPDQPEWYFAVGVFHPWRLWSSS